LPAQSGSDETAQTLKKNSPAGKVLGSNGDTAGLGKTVKKV